MRFVLALLALACAGFAFLVWRGAEPGGIDDLWTRLFGAADLGPVDFERLGRRATPNDALACPPGFCPARADLESPVYPVPGERLRTIVAQAALAEPGVELVFQDRWNEQDRYLARSRLLRFPDTIDARIVGQGEGRSSVALYSRSQIGVSDLGVNRARLARWLAAIDAAVRRDASPDGTR